uniref:Uncharacterized protein n=1 Tax=Dulem virus 194 TaxID=3145671 RepID=A0AAU8AUF0_9VIRU
MGTSLYLIYNVPTDTTVFPVAVFLELDFLFGMCYNKSIKILEVSIWLVCILIM